MALHRKKIKDENGDFIAKPRRCYICKEKKAFHSMHGGLVGHYYNYRGKLCCDDCIDSVCKEEQRLLAKQGNLNELSEGEYQTFGQWL